MKTYKKRVSVVITHMDEVEDKKDVIATIEYELQDFEDVKYFPVG